MSGAVLVIGAGVGGIKASLDLAEAGLPVYLCDQTPAIGGALIRMDKWFPDNHCGMCQMLPHFFRDETSQFCLRRGLIHPGIELLPLTEVKEVKGQAGDFRVMVNSMPAGVNPELCTGCGLCAEVCPVETGNEFNRGLDLRKAIYTPHPYLTPPVYTIDRDNCTRCGVCVEKCPTRAIQLNEPEKQRQLRVGAIILATGFEAFDPCLASQYGYGRFPNVVTSIELERMLSPGGPTGGELLRPSDKQSPKSVAFLQCVGSRDRQRDYCSSACCMIALKEATLIKQAGPRTDVSIFYMDIRAFGKNYYRYYERAKEELGVKFQRCRVPVLKEEPQTNNLILNAVADNGKPVKHRFELVVLSVGQTPSPGFHELCRALGVEENRWGFCQTAPFSAVETAREGVYVCGGASAPRDIADTLTGAGAAACQASRLLAGQRRRYGSSGEQPEPAAGEAPRIGVLLCDCGGEIGSTLDLQQIAEFSRRQPDVVHVEQVPYLCHADAREKVAPLAGKHKINRFLMGACATLAHALLKKDGFGLDLSGIRIVNLREHVAWVHRNNPGAATEKAKGLLAMAIEEARVQEASPVSSMPVRQKALVIGGGLAGMTSALAIAGQGIEVHLVEKSSELGGNLKHVYHSLDDGAPQTLLENLRAQVKTSSMIHLYPETEVADVAGYAGNFEISLAGKNAPPRPLDAGAIVVASGGDEYAPAEYLYGQNEKVITQKELESRLFSAEIDPRGLKSVAMIQCVGSREKERPYCSRICCSQALKNVLRLKEVNPEIEAAIFYRDMTSYGFMEEYYTRAREKGVSFIRYEVNNKPNVRQEEKKLVVDAVEPVLGGRIRLEPDLLVLSPAIVPPDNSGLARTLGVDLNEDGFFPEAEAKFRPVDFITAGVFVCGLAHSPRNIKESITQAQAAAQRAVSLLSRGRLAPGRVVSETRQRQCARCEVCVTICPYTARAIDRENDEITVKEILCQGCGACVVACPSGAAKLRGFKDRQVFSLIDAAF